MSGRIRRQKKRLARALAVVFGPAGRRHLVWKVLGVLPVKHKLLWPKGVGRNHVQDSGRGRVSSTRAPYVFLQTSGPCAANIWMGRTRAGVFPT